MKKRILTCLLVVTLVFVLAGTALAVAPYSFYFTANNGLQTSGPAPATSHPYVQPSNYAQSTTYYLYAGTSSVVASYSVSTGSTTSCSFTYLSGYGGTGQYYGMAGHPTVLVNFGNYSVGGNWSA